MVSLTRAAVAAHPADVNTKDRMGRVRPPRSAGTEDDPLGPGPEELPPRDLGPTLGDSATTVAATFDMEKPAAATIEASGATVNFAATPTPGSGSGETGSWLSEDGEAGPAGDAPPSPATRSSANSAGAAWASSTRPARPAQPPRGPQDGPDGAHAGLPNSWPASATEAEAVATLQHPNIVQIYEVGEHDGLPFFSLEFVEGGTLDRKLAGKPQPPRGPRCPRPGRAMHVAHDTDIIHRDLKPANVLLTARRHAQDHRLRPGQAARRGTRPDASGAIMGTPSYMAPEQAARQDGLRARLRRLRPGRDPLRVTHRPAAVPAARRWTRSMQVSTRRAGAAAAAAARRAARPGDDLPQVPGEGSRQPLCKLLRAG